MGLWGMTLLMGRRYRHLLLVTGALYCMVIVSAVAGFLPGLVVETEKAVCRYVAWVLGKCKCCSQLGWRCRL